MSRLRAGPVRSWALRLVLAIGVLVGFGALSRAEAEWLDDHHTDLCREHRGALPPLYVLRINPTIATCTANCFRYNLSCRDGTRFVLASDYSPYASTDDVFFADSRAGPVVKLLLIGMLGAISFVSIFGTTENRYAIAWQNGIVFVILACMIWVWGIRATNDGFTIGALVDFPAAVKYLVMLIFVSVRFPSFVRGWNYLFVRHPAASIVSAGNSLDVERLATTLAMGAEDHPGIQPAYHYAHQTEKARTLAASLDKEAAVTEARAARERQRAELAEAERMLEQARRRSEGHV